MTDITSVPADGGIDRFDAVETLLARYPEISEAEIASLKTWFRKEASAFDVASIASKDWVSPGYQRFREDHIDRFTPKDLLGAAAVVAAVAVLIAWMVLAGT
ncbi:hypothetical protein ACWPMX_10940 [Tsuneonella sp. HG094]